MRAALAVTALVLAATSLVAQQPTGPDSARAGASGPGSAPATSPPDKDAVLADEARWLAANLPKLAKANVLLQVDEHIGGTGVASGRTWVQHVKLDHCTLTLDRVFEVVGTDPVVSIPRQRLSQQVPLDHVEPRSLGVQQHPLGGPGMAFVGGDPWRLVLAMADGSIRSERDVDAYGVHANRDARIAASTSRTDCTRDRPVAILLRSHPNGWLRSPSPTLDRLSARRCTLDRLGATSPASGAPPRPS